MDICLESLSVRSSSTQKLKVPLSLENTWWGGYTFIFVSERKEVGTIPKTSRHHEKTVCRKNLFPKQKYNVTFFRESFNIQDRFGNTPPPIRRSISSTHMEIPQLMDFIHLHDPLLFLPDTCLLSPTVSLSGMILWYLQIMVSGAISLSETKSTLA